MNKNELKKVLKPLIKECIKEVLFEESGALSHIISEVANGLSVAPTKQVVKETPTPKITNAENVNKALREQKKKLLDAIGKEAYGGVNIFEGTTPAPSPTPTNTHGPLSNVAPNDPGVSISHLITGKSSAIFKRMMEKK